MRPCDVIAVRVAQVMLHVADDRVVPVEEINRAVGRRHRRPMGRKFGIVAIRPAAVRSSRPTARALLAHLDAEDALEANTLQLRKLPWNSSGKWRLDRIPVPGHGREGRFQNSFMLAMLGRVINMAAERRAEVGVVAGGVGDEVVAPVIEDAPVRIGEAVGDVASRTCSVRGSKR